MKAWLLDWFGASKFSKCKHTTLPSMDGLEMEIHLREDAKPTKVSKLISVPLDWGDTVKEQLDSDVALGVIEKVEEPLEWCHRMVLMKKPDGTPRRTIDFQTLNKWCAREEWTTRQTLRARWHGAYHEAPSRPSPTRGMDTTRCH